MTYRDPEAKRRHQRETYHSRRGAWFSDKACARCGSVEDLELDHINQDTKVDHRIWSWSAPRRRAELAKCQALCHRCHKSKSAHETRPVSGVRNGNSKLTEEIVAEIRHLVQSGLSDPDIAGRFSVSITAIRSIRIGRTWR